MIVCDTSAIFTIISRSKTESLSDQYTSPLALYELGNIIWKNSVLVPKYTEKEALELLKVCEKVIEKMRISHSDLNDIYRLAARHRVSFYDAAYVCLAVDLNAPLVTIDEKLIQKVKGVISIISLDQFLGRPKNGAK